MVLVSHVEPLKYLVFNEAYVIGYLPCLVSAYTLIVYVIILYRLYIRELRAELWRLIVVGACSALFITLLRSLFYWAVIDWNNRIPIFLLLFSSFRLFLYSWETKYLSYQLDNKNKQNLNSIDPRTSNKFQNQYLPIKLRSNFCSIVL